MYLLADIIDADSIACRINVSSKKKALHQASILLSEAINSDAVTAAEAQQTQDSTGDSSEKGDELLNEMDILDALIRRERLGSTALGDGIAVPHGRIPGLESPVAALLTLQQGIEFDAPDDRQVDIIFALLVPEDSADEHLNILGQVAERFSQQAVQEGLRRCESEQLQQALDLLSHESEAD